MAERLRGDLPQFWTALAYQLRSYVRTWRFAGLLLFVVAVSAAILASDFRHGADYVHVQSATASAFLQGFLSSVGLVVGLAGAFLGGDALAVDLSGAQGYLMLTQPVRRGTLLMGRFVATALTVAALVLVYFGFAVAGTLSFYPSVPGAVVLSLGAALLYTLAVVAFAFFFSSFFKTPAVAIIASVLILVLGFPIATSLVTSLGSEPWFTLDYGATIITNVFAATFQHEVTRSFTYEGATIDIHTWYAYLWEGVTILASYLAICLGLSYVVYRFKEVKG